MTKDLLLTIGGFLVGLGGLLILWSFHTMDSPNPIFLVEVCRPGAFYWLFGSITLAGFAAMGAGVFTK